MKAWSAVQTCTQTAQCTRNTRIIHFFSFFFCAQRLPLHAACAAAKTGACAAACSANLIRFGVCRCSCSVSSWRCRICGDVVGNFSQWSACSEERSDVCMTAPTGCRTSLPWHCVWHKRGKSSKKLRGKIWRENLEKKLEGKSEKKNGIKKKTQNFHFFLICSCLIFLC